VRSAVLAMSIAHSPESLHSLESSLDLLESWLSEEDLKSSAEDVSVAGGLAAREAATLVECRSLDGAVNMVSLPLNSTVRDLREALAADLNLNVHPEIYGSGEELDNEHGADSLSIVHVVYPKPPGMESREHIALDQGRITLSRPRRRAVRATVVGLVMGLILFVANLSPSVGASSRYEQDRHEKQLTLPAFNSTAPAWLDWSAAPDRKTFADQEPAGKPTKRPGIVIDIASSATRPALSALITLTTHKEMPFLHLLYAAALDDGAHSEANLSVSTVSTADLSWWIEETHKKVLAAAKSQLLWVQEGKKLLATAKSQLLALQKEGRRTVALLANSLRAILRRFLRQLKTSTTGAAGTTPEAEAWASP